MTRIHISEVGPRDGLQSIARVMPLEAKKAWIAAEAAAGVPEIEVGSFVPPSLLPQMADTAELIAFAKGIEGLAVAALVPNLKGAERAIAAGAEKISIPFSMSETHSLKNVRKDHAAMIAEIRLIAERVAEQPRKPAPISRWALPPHSAARSKARSVRTMSSASPPPRSRPGR